MEWAAGAGEAPLRSRVLRKPGAEKPRGRFEESPPVSLLVSLLTAAGC